MRWAYPWHERVPHMFRKRYLCFNCLCDMLLWMRALLTYFIPEISEKYTLVTTTKSDQIFRVLSFPTKSKSHHQILKHYSTILGKVRSQLWTKGRISRLNKPKRRSSTYEGSVERAYITYYFPLRTLSWRKLNKVMRKKSHRNLLFKDVS